jgi:hypothetical protein
MKSLFENISKALTRFLNSYVECMKLYGDALLRGGSYGCA